MNPIDHDPSRDLPSSFLDEAKDEVIEGGTTLFPPVFYFAYDVFSQRAVFNLPLNIHKDGNTERFGSAAEFMHRMMTFFSGPYWAHIAGDIPLDSKSSDATRDAAIRYSPLIVGVENVAGLVATTVYYEALRASAGAAVADRFAEHWELAKWQRTLAPHIIAMFNASVPEDDTAPDPSPLFRFLHEEIEGEVVDADAGGMGIAPNDGAVVSEVPAQSEDEPDSVHEPDDDPFQGGGYLTTPFDDRDYDSLDGDRDSSWERGA